MPFSSILFVHLFLPAFLLVVWAAPRPLKNAVTLAGSLIFYAWGAPTFLPVVLALGFLDYGLSRAIARARTSTETRSRARWLLAAGIVVHLSVLSYFKYSNFFVEQANTVIGWFGAAPFQWTRVILPIGVSFITFEEISYLCDVYRGDAPPAEEVSHYLLFLLLFPHSIAGPIFRWKDLRHQFTERVQTWDGARNGFERFAVGLAKKILIADPLSIIADGAFSLEPERLGSGAAWLGVVAFTLQVYFDFSGYSDMAIGLGRMMGFNFKENFDAPFSAKSMRELWTRWHISLTTWLRDYLYVPLGGSQRGEARTLLNIAIVFVLSGFWHGAAWTFVIWGACHGAYLVLERVATPFCEKLPLFVQHAMTLTFFTMSLAIFRARDVTHALEMLRALLGGAPRVTMPVASAMTRSLPNHAVLALTAGIVIVLHPLVNRYWRKDGVPLSVPALAGTGPLLLFLVTTLHMINARFTPLIYFQF